MIKENLKKLLAFLNFDDAFLNFVVKPEKHTDTIFKNLVDSNSMSKEMFKSAKPVETRLVTMYLWTL